MTRIEMLKKFSKKKNYRTIGHPIVLVFNGHSSDTERLSPCQYVPNSTTNRGGHGRK